MIGRLVGQLVEFDPPRSLIDVAGVGYEVMVAPNTFVSDEIDKECTLFTHAVIDTDSHTLYGFKTRSQRDMYRLLLGVSRVGPSLALAILSTYNVEEVVQFISNEDAVSLKRVKGLGQQGAQRVIVDLRNKIKNFPITIAGATKQPSLLVDDAVAGLMNLGYNRTDAMAAVQLAYHQGIELEDLIKAALARLHP